MNIDKEQANRIKELEAENAKLSDAMATIANNLDCGDSLCMFARNKGGMRTNGGCRCFPLMRQMDRIKIKQAVEKMKDE